MNYDHPAVRKAYPDAVIVDDGNGVFKEDGTEITIDQTLVDAARVELDKLNYQTDRANEYPSVVDQLDLIYHSGIDAWKAKIKETKDKYPKP